MKTWVKVYTEILDDRKTVGNGMALLGWWTLLLMAAGRVDDRDENEKETGALGTAEDVAWLVHASDDELAPVIAHFTKLGMIHEDDGILYLTNYPKRQSRARSARPSAVRERVQRHRARDTSQEATACNEVTSSTKQAPEQNRTEQNREREQTPPRPTTDPNTPLHLQPDPTPPAIMAFREASGLTGPGPSTGPWRAVLKAVGEDQASLDRWKAAVKEWQLRGYSMRNYAGMLDWHDKGVPPRGSPREVKAQLDAQAAEQEAKEAQARALKQWEAHNVHTSDV